MTTNRVTLTITSTDEIGNYKQTTVRNVVVDEVPIEVVHKEVSEFADRLRRQDQLPLDDAGDADPSHVTPLRAVPSGDEQDVLDEHESEGHDPLDDPEDDDG